MYLYLYLFYYFLLGCGWLAGWPSQVYDHQAGWVWWLAGWPSQVCDHQAGWVWVVGWVLGKCGLVVKADSIHAECPGAAEKKR